MSSKYASGRIQRDKKFWRRGLNNYAQAQLAVTEQNIRGKPLNKLHEHPQHEEGLSRVR